MNEFAIKKTTSSQPDPVDVHVGNRLRLRRTMLKMSQEQLAQAIGVSFQQVQKYERGTNRVSASRLYDASRVLNVPIEFFFQDMDKVNSERPTPPTNDLPGLEESADPMMRSESLELVRSYWKISSQASRQQILQLVKSMN